VHCRSCPSVPVDCLSFSPVWALNSRTECHRKTKTKVNKNVPQGRSYWCVNFWLQKSKVSVIVMVLQWSGWVDVARWMFAYHVGPRPASLLVGMMNGCTIILCFALLCFASSIAFFCVFSQLCISFASVGLVNFSVKLLAGKISPVKCLASQGEDYLRGTREWRQRVLTAFLCWCHVVDVFKVLANIQGLTQDSSVSVFPLLTIKWLQCHWHFYSELYCIVLLFVSCNY